MLGKIKREVTITGSSVFEGTIAESYRATIDSDNPNNMNYVTNIGDKSCYKENREECKKDRTEFEDYIYTVQEQMAAEKEATEQD